VTVTLDNNWGNKHVVSFCYFLKMCCYRSPVSIVTFKTLTFHKVVYRHTWGAVGSLVIVSLLIFSRFWQRKNFENRLIFDKVKAYKKWCQFYCANFLGNPVCKYLFALFEKWCRRNVMFADSSTKTKTSFSPRTKPMHMVMLSKRKKVVSF